MINMQKLKPKKKYNVIDWRIRFWSKVDKSGDCWLWTAAKSDKGYGVFRLGDRQEKAHRLSYVLEHGEIPEGLVIDHKCHVKPCVRPEHLRPVTQKQNIEHQSGLAKHNKSGYRGVHWETGYGQWKVTIKHNGKLHFFGRYDDLHEAGEVARVKRNELFTHNDNDKPKHMEYSRT